MVPAFCWIDGPWPGRLAFATKDAAAPAGLCPLCKDMRVWEEDESVIHQPSLKVLAEVESILNHGGTVVIRDEEDARRGGMLIAALLVYAGHSARQAVRMMRQVLPVRPDKEQLAWLFGFRTYLDTVAI